MDGAGGDDTLEGLGGDDLLVGGEGSDVYFYSAGDARDHIFDWNETPDEADTLRLYRLERRARPARHHLPRCSKTGRILLDSAAIEAAAEIERVEFEDGTVWTPSDLAARVELLPGTERADALWGTSQGDVIYGFGGEDELFGNGGDDFSGGRRRSRYLQLRAGRRQRRGGQLRRGRLAGPDSIQLRRLDRCNAHAPRKRPVLKVGNGGNEISLRSWYGDANRKIDSVFFFGDSANWDAAMLEELAPAGNGAPELAGPLPDQAALEDEGSAFPFRRTASAIPMRTTSPTARPCSTAHPFRLAVVRRGAAVVFRHPRQRRRGERRDRRDGERCGRRKRRRQLQPRGHQHQRRAAVAGEIADQSDAKARRSTSPFPPALFTDPDASDSLTLSAELPAWLSFDGESFSGTPGNADAGEYTIEVKASDAAGATAATSFRLMVEDTPAPIELIGTRHNDVLNGSAADEVFVGLGGNDRLHGGLGDDVMSMAGATAMTRSSMPAASPM